MENGTMELIENITKCKSKDEFMQMLETEHQRIKNKLMQKGIMFFDIGSPFSEDMVGDQKFVGAENVGEALYYEELNFIKNGVTTGWVTRLEDVEKFQEIQTMVSVIADKLSNE